MTSGLWNEWNAPHGTSANDIDRLYFECSDDPIKCVLERDLVAPPGEKFTYSGGNTVILGDIIRTASGMPIDMFAKNLFDPLGVDSVYWFQYDNGVYATDGSMRMTSRDMLKLGIVYLENGTWHGRRILPSEWVELSGKPYHNNVGIKVPIEERVKVRIAKFGKIISYVFTGRLVIYSIVLTLVWYSCAPDRAYKTIYLIGDSTMADYSGDYDPGKDYYETRYPMTGWGQVFQETFVGFDPRDFGDLITTDSVLINNHARGGRSTRTFFEEGRWEAVNDSLRPGDLVLIQFGHNDASINKPDRYVDIDGFKEYLRLYVNQSREKGAIPVILTPVARNYPWRSGLLANTHGEYPRAAREVGFELDVHLIDLNELSMQAFTEKGKGYVAEHYFMNIPPGKYPAYPSGLKDNTHFQPEGARVVAQIVHDALKEL